MVLFEGSGALCKQGGSRLGKWYYVYSSKALAVNTTTPDGYHVNYNGEIESSVLFKRFIQNSHFIQYSINSSNIEIYN